MNKNWTKVEEYIWEGKYGYLVNVGVGKEQLHESFAISTYGSADAALAAARASRDLKVKVATFVKNARYGDKWKIEEKSRKRRKAGA